MRCMKTFVESFIEHVRESGVQIPEIHKRTGVSKDKMNALMNNRARSTSVDDAMKLAKFFGKTIEEFCSTPPDVKMTRIKSLFDDLTESEQALVEAQLEGLRALRDQSKN